ncbi:hypothetical protein M9H77_04994 [Catharanthus roseus]|uniref:Uncharacterized protein n=1 Tax=Catharanthus roseus TaxID=4058 RepID=A0ACC0CFP4_CATRO|nr:hypothetical protein M9H77_04994 [Catharanthus roseus]
MATNKFLSLLLLALFAISMVATIANAAQYHPDSVRMHDPNSISLFFFVYLSGKSGFLSTYWRCSQTQYKKPCLFFCQKCCRKCLCVPPGFYGNKQVCPCYNNWKTKRGGPKCP